MAREILPTASLPSAQPVVAPQAAPISAQASPPQERDALAGALPEWDLLPASPFVRRVK